MMRWWMAILVFYIILLCSAEQTRAVEIDWIDDRFGLAGTKLIAKQMGIKNYLSWGNEIKPTAVDKFYRDGQENLLYVGKLDNYNDVCTEYRVSYGIDGKPNCGNFSLIASLATRYKGKYWAIANEPDFYPYTSPDEYAKWYHDFYEEIKRYDHDAKVSVGGNFINMHKNVASLWGVPNLLNNSEFKQIISGISNETIKEIYRQNAWLVLFRYKYKQMYGTDPKIDYWNIHNYPNRYYKGVISDSVIDAKEQLDSILNYINYIGDSNKLVWVTEFSIYDGEGCGDWDDCNNKNTDNIRFMEEMIRYYIEKGIDRWYWFYGGNMEHNASCNIWYKDGVLNDLGKKYIELANYWENLSPVECRVTQGDYDGNEIIDINDLLGWYLVYKSGQYQIKADFNCDNTINASDLLMWYGGYR